MTERVYVNKHTGRETPMWETTETSNWVQILDHQGQRFSCPRDWFNKHFEKKAP